jgi:predicted deacylase
VDGANLARIFPGDPDAGPSSRLAAALFALLDGVDLLFDSHSGGVELAFLPVAGFYAEGAGVSVSAAAASRALAEATGLANLWELPPQPGVLSFEAARRGVPVTGCEVGGRGYAAPGDVALYRDAYLRVLTAHGMIPEIAPLTRSYRLLRGNWTLSLAAGLVRPLQALGASVSAGEVVARVSTPLGEAVADLVAPTDGVIMAERNLCRIREGDLAVCVATVEPLP